MRQGKVKWYNGKKCFGFITPDTPNENGNTDDVFVHSSALKAAGIRFLNENEFQKLKIAKLPTESLNKVRDLFVIQCLTGLSFTDLMDFDFSMIEEMNGHHYINAKRNKTGIEYCAVLLPDVMKIVKRYNGKLPKFSIQQYNMRLKLVAGYAGINKDIASHW